MMEIKLISYLLNKMLLSKEYNISEIALYTGAPEDVIHQLACGYDMHLSFLLSRKIIELYRIKNYKSC